MPDTATAPPPADVPPLGAIYLPASPGTPVGRFEFIVDPATGGSVEVGTLVAADTAEGVIIGSVVDMWTVGTSRDPISADLRGSTTAPLTGYIGEVMVAGAQVLHSPSLRPVRSGTVRPATAAEVDAALGQDRISWHMPAGVIPLADGSLHRVSLDGHFVAGPEGAGVLVGGKSGLASKSSFVGVLLRSALHSARTTGETCAAIVFNVKGEDLIWLDKPPLPGYELTDDDHAIYRALGTPAEPFPHVDVYAPALPGGDVAASPRPDASQLRWDLRMIWPYLRHLYPAVVENDNLANLLADLRAEVVGATGGTRCDTLAELDAWFTARFEDADADQRSTFWRSHHIATGRRAHKLLTSLPNRCGGLVSRGSSRDMYDIPDSGWRDQQVIVVDIAGLPQDVQGIVMARTFERLMRAAEDGRLGVDHLICVGDELNAFAPQSGGEHAVVKKVFQRLATQGRYAGFALWAPGQNLSKVDELIRGNVSTLALGVSTDAELSSGVYGKLPAGLSEQIMRLAKGQMAIWHYAFRAPIVLRFPRPAWQTGRTRAQGGARPAVTDSLGLSPAAVGRLLEGTPPEVAERIIAEADDPALARARLERVRVPDMRKTELHAASTADPADPFALDTP
ncbi:hypothetical protein [Bailinhaonella thermotolerans]|uniref:ATP-binding protein n=1 Tax=Bailinhaonella thermotolerans TaxID=1070861 RepID=A0A3A4A6A8_9ACTN|nr:hypothetical protein [Bailinhaonella thermotolerans]RJL21247.1 hypothetical protein D5H75_37915 [Bailinhaonella thermotolerans]